MVLVCSKEILVQAYEVIANSPRIIEKSLLKGQSIVFVGDTHGDIDITHEIIKNFITEPLDDYENTLVFLGDYVDRNVRDIENINYILRKKIEYPEKIVLLRGNHEEFSLNRRYGFFTNLIENQLEDLYPDYERIFSVLPLAFLNTDYRVFACHGMIPVVEVPVSLNDIENLPKIAKFENFPTILAQIIWNDPDPNESDQSTPSWRGLGINVGRNDLLKFMNNNNISLIIRSHFPYPEGYRLLFNEKILSIFSTPNYGGKNNPAIIARIFDNGLTELLKHTRGISGFILETSWQL